MPDDVLRVCLRQKLVLIASFSAASFQFRVEWLPLFATEAGV